MKYNFLKYVIFILVLQVIAVRSYSQGLTSNYGNFAPCSAPIELYTFDFTNTANNSLTQAGIFIENSDPQCCNLPASNTGCIFFNVIIDPNAIGVSFSVAGATGSVSIYYDNCSTTFAANTQICLNAANAYIDPITGQTYHRFMFCRSGQTTYDFTFNQLVAPSASPDIVTAIGCNQTLSVAGLTNPVWTSISPGTTGQYNNLLSCTSCSTTVYSPTIGTPQTLIYQVSGTIASPCIQAINWSDQVSVTTYPTLFASPGPNTAICNGSVTGTTVSATAIGGTAPYTYNWIGPNGFTDVNTHNNTTDNITVLQPGVYTVIISDGTGCPAATTSVTVTSFNTDIIANAGPDQTVCGSPTPVISINGSVSATGTGIWSGGNGTYNSSTSDLTLLYTPSASEISAGNVTLTLSPTNTAGCPSTPDQITITLAQFTSVVNPVIENVSCFGLTDGSIDLSVSGGVAITSYAWTPNGQNTEDIVNLGAGAYSVLITDANGCTQTANFTVTQPTVLSGLDVGQTNVSCFGGNDGSVSVEGAGGTPNYSYTLGGGTPQSSGTFSGLTTGSYTITITDAENCTFPMTVNVTEPLPLTVALDNQVDILCFGGATGAINITASGGTPTYNYSWTGPNGFTSASADLTGLVAGTYLLNVTDANGNAGGCLATLSVTLTQPLAPLAVALDNQVNILCFGGATGAINITASGGTPTYNYSWTGPNGYTSTAGDLTGLVAGTYNLSVTDANGTTGGCLATLSVTLTQPLAPLAVALDSQVDILCFGGATGAINITASGGTPNYNYSWTGPNGFTSASADLTGLVAGTYLLNVTDANGNAGGCLATLSVSLTQPLAPLAVALDNQVDILCFGGATGAINITASGGTPTYNYSWTGPNGFTSASADLTGLVAGTYLLNVTDANGTAGGCLATLSVTLTQPLAPLAVALDNQVDILCFGGATGAINITASGGTPNYNYSWTGPNGFTSASADLTGLVAGTYLLNVTDANGTTGGCLATLSVTLTQPLAPLAVALDNQVDILCFGGATGAINITASGGTPTYNYSWTGPNGFTSSAGDLTGLVAGTYNLSVTDANGNTGGCFATLSVTLTQPLAPLAVALDNQVDILCFGGATGAINITASGGTPNYNYSWTGPNGFTSASADLTGLVAGTYLLNVTDANGTAGGCLATLSVTLTQPLAPLAVALDNQVDILCFGGATGAINITASGGTPNYNYSWTGPNGFTSASADLTGLVAGTYFLNVTDANGNAGGCLATLSVTLTQSLAPLAVALDNQVDILCFGGATGAINITASGGTPTYNYSWTGPNGYTSTAGDLTGLVAGTYNLSVTDANGNAGGCLATLSVSLTQPLAPLAVALDNQVDILCFGGATGAINITASGGTPTYNYSWTGPNGFTSASADLTGLIAGTYLLNVTDANGTTGGCLATLSVTLTQPLAPLAVALDNQVDILCFGGATGAINITASGGTPTYNYSWTGPNGFTSASADLTGLVAGTYLLNVTDANGTAGGCLATLSVTLTQPLAPLAVALDNQVDILCFGGATGAINITASGGTPNYNYSWTGPNGFTSASADLTGLVAGTYLLNVTDANGNAGGCLATLSVTLTQPIAPLAVALDNQVDILCFGGATGAINITASGGTPNYNYSWTGPNGFTSASADLTGLVAGTYLLNVTDANGNAGGCLATLSVTLTQPIAPLAVALDNQVDILCFGGATGAINITASGGTPNYNYSWTGPNGFTSASADLTGLVAGTYLLNVTDANGTTGGCLATLSVTLTQPLAPLAVALDNQVDILCFGGATGAINITASGGTPTYNYSWTGPNGFTSASADLTGLVAGTYLLNVTDANGTAGGCLATLSVTLTQPLAPLAVALDNQVDILCFGAATGAINITASGGTPTYNYSWTGPNGFTSASADLTGLVAGTYLLNVTDANGNAGGCLATLSVTLTQPLAPLAVALDNQVDILCFGGATGAINITASGGTPTYNYSWTGPNGYTSTAGDLTGLVAGTYNLSVTDANGNAGGCLATLSVTLTQPLAPLAVALDNQVDILCFGGATGAINITASGGTPTYNYSWTGPNGYTSTSADLTGLVAGTYLLNVTDANGNAGGCLATLSVTLTEPTAPVSVTESHVDVFCFGAATGSINITASGGTPTYNYSWTGPNGFTSTADDLTGLVAGTYNLSLTDANGTNGGCLATLSIVIDEPLTGLTLVETHSNVSCFGGNNGSIDLTPQGGTPPYTYDWNNDGTGDFDDNQDLNNLTAGTYTVVVNDVTSAAGNCQATLTVVISEPNQLTVALDNQVDILCFGGATGAINITASGGTPTYNYSWTGPNAFTSASADLTGLVAGTYLLNVTDANGTTGGCLATLSVTLTQPLAPLAVALDNQVDILCFGGATGAINITASGGTPTYNYSWTGPNGFTSASADLTGLVAGTYLLNVTDANGTAGGCLATLSVTLTQPLAPLAVALDNQVDILCFGGATGAINITASGGTPTYNYSWTGPNGYTSTAGDLTGLVAGTYNLSVTDANGTTGGCLATLSVTLTQPLAPLAVALDNQVDILCFGGATGAINITASGGTPTYNYSWTGPNGFTSASADLTGLVAGTYLLNVTDANGTAGGCLATLSVTLTQPLAPLAVALDNQVDILCFGGATGAINITASGGTPTYNYSWTGPNGFNSTAGDLTGLVAGTYNLSVTDANGTTGGCLATLSVTLTQPLAPLAVALDNQVDILCFGGATGAINITASGGTPTYNYSWTGPNGFTSASADLTGLVAGTYLLNVTDANGNAGGCLATLSVTLTQPLAPLAVALDNQVDILCFGGATGAINITASGGTPTYNYSWTGPNGFTSTSADLTGLVAGTYLLNVTDANGNAGGCLATLSVTLTEPTAPVSVTESHVDVFCFGAATGSINITASGGTPTYNYSWTGPNGFTSTADDLTGLVAGTYNLSLTDANGTNGGCLATLSIVIDEPLTGLTLVETHSNVSCFGGNNGSIDLTPQGGTPPYTYDWNNDGTGDFDDNQDLNNLTAGTYTVVVNDVTSAAGNCQATLTVVISEPNQLTVALDNQVDILCFGGATGAINITASGGTPTYNYSWTGPNGFTSTSADLTGLVAGTYLLNVTDANGTAGGCLATLSVTLTQPLAPLAVALDNQVDILCFGGATGAINITASGGTPTYNYSWTGPNGFTSASADLTGLVAGTYLLNVTDANGNAGGCLATLSVTLTQPLAPLAVALDNQVDILCFGGATGAINITASGGTPTYNYSWTGPNGFTSASADLTGLVAGTYLLNVTDANGNAGGCLATLSVTLTQPLAPLAVALDNQVDILCFGGATGAINITASGGTPTYNYSWTGPNGFTSTSADLTGLVAGTYLLNVTDANGNAGGCFATLSVTLTQPLAPLAVALDNQVDILCFGGATGAINITASGGTPTYNYSWTGPNGFTSTSADLTGLVAGTYLLNVTDANGTAGGCLAELIVSLSQPQAVLPIATVISNYNGEDISCFGLSDGAVSVTVSGGVPNYVYEWFNPAGVSIGFGQTQSGLSSGIYTVKVTDQNGCQNQTTVTVTEPQDFSYAVTVTSDYNGEDISCFGASDGSVDLVVSGGTPNYLYTWTNSSNTIISSIQDPTSLSAGTYEVEVTDVNGCSFDTTITLNQPDQLGAIASVTSNYNGEDVSCYQSTDGSLTVNVIGGTPAYTYSWFDNAGGQIGTLVDQDNVGAGNYTVQITDINGCQITVGTTVSEPSPVTSLAQITSNYFGQAISCVGETDGTVSATAGGGVPGYTYSWNTNPIQTTNQLSNLGEGTYTVTVTDLNGCTSISQVTLTANPLPIINLPPGSDECVYNSVLLEAPIEPGGSAVWEFSDGQTFTGFGPHVFNYTGNGCTDLTYTLTNAQGCTNQQLLEDYLCPLPSPNASFTHDPMEITAFDNGVNFTNTSTGASNYLWIFGDGSPNETVENPYHEYLATDDFNEINYQITLIAYSPEGCVDTAISYIELKPDLIYYVPNAFTPDGDDHNGLFKPVFSTGFSIDKYSFMIFNRWGELIYETQEIGAGWDGSYKGFPCQEGVYTWKIQFMKSNNAYREMEVGHVTLLRGGGID